MKKFVKHDLGRTRGIFRELLERRSEMESGFRTRRRVKMLGIAVWEGKGERLTTKQVGATDNLKPIQLLNSWQWRTVTKFSARCQRWDRRRGRRRRRQGARFKSLIYLRGDCGRQPRRTLRVGVKWERGRVVAPKMGKGVVFSSRLPGVPHTRTDCKLRISRT